MMMTGQFQLSFQVYRKLITSEVILLQKSGSSVKPKLKKPAGGK